MSDTRRVTSDLKQGDSVMSSSIAATEAFEFLNELQKREYRGRGDTPTAARDRAARQAGVSRAQAERLWKRWEQMKTVNGDTYRALRNRYEALCLANETAADGYRAERIALRSNHAVDQRPAPAGVGTDAARD